MKICRDCDIDTNGLAVCHCATCHATFGSISGFDAHRTGPMTARWCLHPNDVPGKYRLIERGGIWKWEDSGRSRPRRDAQSDELAEVVPLHTPSTHRAF